MVNGELTKRCSIIFVALCSLLSFAGCGQRGIADALSQTERLLEVDSVEAAVALLDSIEPHAQTLHKSQRMCYELLRAEGQNKTYTPFTTDSVLREVVRYYKSHGTSNERLRAHYLLGCAYRDMHETPIALLTWEDAIAAVDTTSADCDFATLYRVFGQMAEVFMWQHMPKNELNCRQHYCKYALLAGDTLASFKGRLLFNSAYYALGDTSAIFENVEITRQLFLSKGLKAEAAQVWPTAIQVAVESAQFERASAMMQQYETESCLFDDEGNIIDPSRIQYHYYKGLYLLGINSVVPAETQFRTLLDDSLDLIDGYRGLFMLYQAEHEGDSARKYAQLYELALEHYLNQCEADAIVQTLSLYNYRRNERLALEQHQKLTRLRIIITIAGLSLLIIATLVFLKLRKAKRDRERKIIALLKDLKDAEANKNRLEYEISTLNENLKTNAESQQLLAQKEAELQSLSAQLMRYEKEARKQETGDMITVLKQTDIVKKLYNIARPRVERKGDSSLIVPMRIPTNDEWETLYKTAWHYIPTIYTFIDTRLSQSTQEFKTALLVLLDFQTKAIALLLDTSASRVSNIKEKINNKLFGVKGTKSLTNNLKKIS